MNPTKIPLPPGSTEFPSDDSGTPAYHQSQNQPLELKYDRELFYRTLSESSMDMIFIIDREDRVVYVNEYAAASLGKKTEEMIGLSRTSFFFGENGKTQQASLHKVFETGRVYAAENYLTLPHGKAWLHTQLLPLANPNGEVMAVMGIARDISGRKQAEQALAESEQKYRVLVESLPVGIGITDEQGNVHLINPAISQMTGYTLDEIRLIGAAGMYADPIERVNILKHLEQQGSVTNYKIRMRKKDGGNIIARFNMSTLRMDGNSLILTVVTDITEIEQANVALQEINDRFRATFEQAAVGITHINLDGYFLRVNQRFCEIVGYSEEELRQRTYMEITHPEDLDFEFMEQLLAGDITTFSMDKRYVKKNGRLIWVHMTASLLRDSHGVPRFHIGVVEDISRRKKAEAALEKARRTLEKRVAERTSRLRSLTRQLVNAQDAERKRIARELHDDVGQSLLGLTMSLGMLLEQAPEDALELRQKVGEAIDQVAEMINGLRTLSRGLHPAALEIGGLHLSLEQLCANISKQASLMVQYSGLRLNLPENMALCLYRVAQEALANVVKHARAERVEVKLGHKNNWVVLTVQDDGVGFKRSRIGYGMGLLSMEERVTSLNGRLMLQGNAHGTRLTAAIPWQDEQSEEM